MTEPPSPCRIVSELRKVERPCILRRCDSSGACLMSEDLVIFGVSEK